jgi:hypothetical protein
MTETAGPSPGAEAALPAAPTSLRRAYDKLDGRRKALVDEEHVRAEKLRCLGEYLGVAPEVESALKALGEELFGKLTKLIEEKLTLALQEVLSQPICVKVEREFKRGGATMGFHVERGGQAEDIMRGQGGSVANVLSVGLRIFALAQSDPKGHRRFLVLDEQDCWLAPELVPRLVKIIHDAGTALGFQTLLISHHDVRAFEQYADRIYRFIPTSGGVSVEDVTPKASHAD